MRRSSWVASGLAFYAVTSLVSMAAMSVGAVVAGICILIGVGGMRGFSSAMAREWGCTSSRLYLSLSLFLAFTCALSLVGGFFFPLNYGGMEPRIHFLSDMAKTWYLFWPLVLVVGLRELTSSERIRILQIWIVAFAALSALGIVQYFVGWPRPHLIPGNEPRHHAVMFLGHHLSVASIFIFPFFAVLDLCMKKNAERVRENRFHLPWFFLILAAALGFFALLATYSRMLWVALPVGLLVLGLVSLPRRWTLATLCVICFGIWGALQIPSVSKRLNDSEGHGPRKELWAANLEFFKRRPLTGVGWHHNLELSGFYLQAKRHEAAGAGTGSDAIEVFSGHAHNNAIEMLSSTGLLGLGAWILWSVFVIVLLWFARKARGDWVGFSRGLCCAWLVFHLNGLTQVNFWESKVLHQMMWMVAWTLFWVSTRNNEV